jgi:hypothetical protein
MEPEEDGDLSYWACTTCGYEVYDQARSPADPSCQLGIPEEVRLRGSVIPAGTLQPGDQIRLRSTGGPVDITIGCRPQ